MSYSATIRTRSSDFDYDWMVAAPSEIWWENGNWGPSPLRQAGRRNAIQRIGPSGIELYLTGILSSRLDGTSSRRPIRYELLLHPDPNGSLNREDLQRVIALWLDDLSQSAESSKLGALLDDAVACAAASSRVSIDRVLSASRANQQGNADDNSELLHDNLLAESLSSSINLALHNMQHPYPDINYESQPDYLWVGFEGESRRRANAVFYSDKPFAFYEGAPQSDVERNHLRIDEDITLVVKGIDGSELCPVRATEIVAPVQHRVAIPEVMHADPKHQRGQNLTAQRSQHIPIPAVAIPAIILVAIILALMMIF